MQAPTRPTVIVVNDDPIILELMERQLGRLGCEMIGCRSEAQPALLIQQVEPAVVILDIHLDKARRGWDILRQLRTSPETQRIPIIICTGDYPLLEENIKELRALHCLILEKPFMLAELESILNEAMRQGNEIDIS